MQARSGGPQVDISKLCCFLVGLCRLLAIRIGLQSGCCILLYVFRTISGDGEGKTFYSRRDFLRELYPIPIITYLDHR